MACTASALVVFVLLVEGLATPSSSGLLPGVSLFDVLWGYSDLMAEEILHSSSFLEALRSGNLTEDCYTTFTQQEALYLCGVSGTLETAIRRVQGPEDIRTLLLDTQRHYSTSCRRNQSILASTPPPWLRLSLQSFHAVVLEDPVYWLVALSARAGLRAYFAGQLLTWKPGKTADSGPRLVSGAGGLYQQWSADSLKESTWTDRYRQVMDKYQDHVDVFKAVNVFREHTMNQKHLHKAVSCGQEEGTGAEPLMEMSQSSQTRQKYTMK